MSVKISVNGKPMEVEPGITVEGLLTLLNVKREYTAVAVNRDVTPKSDYDDGDAVRRRQGRDRSSDGGR